MLNPCEEALKKHIQTDGSISLGAFMNHALTHPEHGYYMTRDPFGVRGDFITAPEISQLFGEMIGAWVTDIWHQMGQPEINLVECGPGRGTLMADITRVIKNTEGFSDKVNITLIETSPVLIAQQKEVLKTQKVEWVSSINQLDSEHPSIIIGNEFLDALPIEQIIRTSEGWHQRYVKFEDESFNYEWQNAEEYLVAMLPEKTQSNVIYEVSPAQHEFMLQCCDHIKRTNGVALLIDYGYAKKGHGETLQAVRKNTYAKVLRHIGETDITAHVNFAALKETVEHQNLACEKIITQAEFLQNLGIEIRAQMLMHKKDISEDVKRLISPEQMGDLFKVFCSHNGNQIKPAGF